MSEFALTALRKAVAAGRIHWHQHALERMLERNLSPAEVIEAINNGEVIEVYPADRPHASALMLYSGAKPVHVVVAADPSAEICHVITAYRPDDKHFESDLRTRRKQ